MITFIETILGLVYNLCFIGCYWPQIIKSWKTKKVEDVSVSLYFLSVLGYMCATSYAVLRFGLDFWLLSNYILSGLSASFMIYIFFKFKKVRVW